MKLDFRQLYLNREGRLDRTAFWLAGIILASLFMVVKYIAGLYTVSLASIAPQQTVQIIVYVVTALIPLAFLYPAYCLLVKRGYDRDRSPAVVQALLTILAALYLFPKAVILIASQESARSILQTIGTYFWIIYLLMAIAATYLLIDYGLKSGTKAANRFGAEPL